MSEDKHFPARGKWDFSDDDKRLAAIQLQCTANDWQGGHAEGRKVGMQLAKQAWAIPVSLSAIVIVAIVSFTVIAVKRPDLVKWPDQTFAPAARCSPCGMGSGYHLLQLRKIVR